MPDAGASIHGCDMVACEEGQTVGCNPSGKASLFHDDSGSDALLLARWPNVLQADDAETGSKRGDWRFETVLAAAPVVSPYIESFTVAAGPSADRALSWAEEEAPYARGYWSFDWADAVMRLGAISRTTSGDALVNFTAASHSMNPTAGARFVGLNLLAELDVPGEYYISPRDMLLYYMPHANDTSSWTTDPVLATAAGRYALSIANSTGITVTGLRVAHAAAVGIFAPNNTDLIIQDCAVDRTGGHGIDVEGTGNRVDSCRVEQVGCKGIMVHGGEARMLRYGNNVATRNTIRRWGNYKRTFQPAVWWTGVGNTYSHNDISGGPHSGISGGGNEGDGVECTFEYNTIDRCAFETADVGAFYTCGQGASSLINVGNVLRHNTITRTRATTKVNGPGGPHGPGAEQTVQTAIYLDDLMSGWRVENNTVADAHGGLALCGGRDYIVMGNRFRNVDLPVFFDNRGMEGERPQWQCEKTCNFTAGECAGCPPAGVAYELSGPAGEEWSKRWPRLVTEQTDPECYSESEGLKPCHSRIAGNTFCGSNSSLTVDLGGLGFISLSNSPPPDNNVTKAWGGSVVKDNVRVPEPGCL